MPTPSQIKDGRGTNSLAGVTKIGQLIVAPFKYDDTMFVSLDVDDTAYNFYPPRHQKQFVITGVLLYGQRDINNATDTNIIVYESSAIDSLTEDKVLIHTGLASSSNATLSPLNILVSNGKWVNAKTDDSTVFMTITGYYIPQISG